MNPKKQFFLGNSELKDADIAFFPMIQNCIYAELKVETESIIDKEIIGVANLTPVVLHGIKCSNTESVFYGANQISVKISFYEYSKGHSRSEIYKFWKKTTDTFVEGSFTKLWVIAPQVVCDILFRDCAIAGGFFYYHFGFQEKPYSLITRSFGKSYTQPIHERNLLCLS
jgi:hypothetical protein